jgi:hypothetical protein
MFVWPQYCTEIPTVVISTEEAKFVTKNKQKSKQIDVKYKNSTVLCNVDVKGTMIQILFTWFMSKSRYPSVLRIVV